MDLGSDLGGGRHFLVGSAADLCQRDPTAAFPHEVGQVEGIASQSVPGQTADAALVQKAIDPTHLSASGLSDDPKRALRAAEVGAIDQLVTHALAFRSSS